MKKEICYNQLMILQSEERVIKKKSHDIEYYKNEEIPEHVIDVLLECSQLKKGVK